MNQINEFILIIAIFFPTFGAIRLLFISQPEIDRIIVGIAFTYTFILILSCTTLCGFFIIVEGFSCLSFNYSDYKLSTPLERYTIVQSFNAIGVFIFLLYLTKLFWCLVKRVHLHQGRLDFSTLEIELIFLNVYITILTLFLFILLLATYLYFTTEIGIWTILEFLCSISLLDIARFFSILKAHANTFSLDILLTLFDNKTISIASMNGIDLFINLYLILTFLLVITDIEKNKKFNLDDFLFFLFFIYHLIYYLL